MPPFISAWLEQLVTEAGILKKAPGASLVLALLVAIAGGAAGWFFHSSVYSAAQSAKDDRISGLKDENDRLQKQIAAQSQNSTATDPDSIYQGGVKMGSAQQPYAALSEGKYYFGVIRVSGDFNPRFMFTYRGIKLKMIGEPSSSTQTDARGTATQFLRVTCQVVE